MGLVLSYELAPSAKGTATCSTSTSIAWAQMPSRAVTAVLLFAMYDPEILPVQMNGTVQLTKLELPLPFLFESD